LLCLARHRKTEMTACTRQPIYSKLA
jgi:hypothetical protein